MSKATFDALMKAFAGESQARNRYTFYAGKARSEGYVQIAQVFTLTADNEKEHAERFFKLLAQHGTQPQPFPIEITADFPVALGSTFDNLLAAAEGEHDEHALLYPEFARAAQTEGFTDVATAFTAIASVEGRHEARFRSFAERIRKNTVFSGSAPAEWLCLNCGYVHNGLAAPEICPACLHPKAYYAPNHPM